MNYLKKPLTYLSILALSAGAFAISPAQAGPHHKHGAQHKKVHMLKQLDLSEKQKAEVRAIMKNAKKQKQALHSSMKAYKQAMSALIESPNYSEQAVRDLQAQYQSVFADKAVISANAKHKINAILTPEQQAKKVALKEKMKQRWEMKKQRRAERQTEQ